MALGCRLALATRELNQERLQQCLAVQDLRKHGLDLDRQPQGREKLLVKLKRLGFEAFFAVVDCCLAEGRCQQGRSFSIRTIGL